MENVLFVLVIAIVVLFFAAPLIALFKAGKAKRIATQTEERLAQLTARVYALEQQLKKFSELAARVVVVESRTNDLNSR